MTTSERLARAALEAETRANHAEAAVLYWAASMFLQGHSLTEVELALEAVGHCLPWGILSRGDDTPQPSDDDEVLKDSEEESA